MLINTSVGTFIFILKGNIMAKRFTNVEMELLRNNPYVKSVRDNRLSLTYEFRCILYDSWILNKSIQTVKNTFILYNFDLNILDRENINSLLKNFKSHGRPKGAKNKIIYQQYSYGSYTKDNVDYLLSTGCFKPRGNSSVSITDAFFKECKSLISKHTLNEIFTMKDIDLSRVSYQRLYLLSIN